jgi:hypothetical protein
MIHLFGLIHVNLINLHRITLFDILLIIGALFLYEEIVDSMWDGSSDLTMLRKVGQIYSLFIFFY